MEINTNLSNAVAASISKLNLNTAKRAFEAQKTTKEETNETVLEEQTENLTGREKIKSSIDVEDIQKYAKYMGENLSIDDINYALTYGRSVIADYSV